MNEYNITTPHTSIPKITDTFIIQAFTDGNWKDVDLSKSENSAKKKARHYRNQHSLQTRVVKVTEYQVYAYDYTLVEAYSDTPELTFV